jgi:hypothetical protein
VVYLNTNLRWKRRRTLFQWSDYCYTGMRKVPKNSIKISKCRRTVQNVTTHTPTPMSTSVKCVKSKATSLQEAHIPSLQGAVTNRTDVNFINAKEYINIVVMNGAIRISDNQLIMYSGTYNKPDRSKAKSATQLKVSFSGCPFTNNTLLIYVGDTTDINVSTALNEVAKKVVVCTTPLSDTITETVINEYKIDHYSTAILNVVKALYSDNVQVCRVFVLATHDISKQKQYDQLATVLRATYNTDLIEVHDSQLAYGLLNTKREPLTVKKYCDKINEMDITPVHNVLKTVKIYKTELLDSVVYTPKSKGSISLRDSLMLSPLSSVSLCNESNASSMTSSMTSSMIRIGLFHGVVSIRELYNVLKQNCSLLLNEVLRYAYAVYKLRYTSIVIKLKGNEKCNTLTIDTLKSDPKLKNSINTIANGGSDGSAVASFVRKAVKCGYNRDTILHYLSTVVPDYDHSMYVYTYFGGKTIVKT